MRLYRALAITIMTGLALSPISTLADSFDNAITAYRADLYAYNYHTPKNRHRSRIVMSRWGVRIESKELFKQGEKGIYIQRFNPDSSWVISPKKKQFSQLKPEIEASDNTIIEPEIRGTGGIMSSEACMELEPRNKTMLKTVDTNNDSIALWHCQYPQGASIQGFSQRWKIVVFEQLDNGDTSELSNIKSHNFNESFFAPPAHFQEVSLPEFYLGAPILTKYKEPLNKS